MWIFHGMMNARLFRQADVTGPVSNSQGVDVPFMQVVYPC
jgi:hypothetical protein